MRKLALAAAAAALIAALVWRFMRDPASPAEIATPPQANAPSAREEAALALTAPEPSRAEAARAAETNASVESTPATESPTPQAPAELELRGTITVADEQGIEHPSEDGRLGLVLWPDATRSRSRGEREVAVAAGAWSTTIPADVAFVGLRGIELGGRVAALPEQVGDPWVTLPIPAARTLDLRARWLYGALLRVRALDTGLDLDAVELIRIESWPENSFPHPGEAKRIVVHAAARSPVDLPLPGMRLSSSARSIYCARAPGYAWGRIEIDPLADGERLLELPRGGGLGIQLVGARAGRGTMLRLRAAAGDVKDPQLEIAVGEHDRFEVESVPAGSYVLSAELGDWDRVARTLGTVAAEVNAGDRAQVELELRSLAADPLVDLRGVLVLPEAWALDAFNLWVDLLDAPLHGQEPLVSFPLGSRHRIEGSTDTYRWGAGRVQPGRYELELFQLAYGIALEVPATGRSDVRFEIPPPGLVSVRAIDRASGADTEVEDIHWYCRRPEWTNGGNSLRAEKHAETGRWGFRAPQTAVVVSAWDRRYADARIEVQVGPGTTEVTLELSRATALLVILKDGSATIPLGQSSDVEVEPVAGDGRVTSYGGSSRGARIAVSAPGRYRVRVPTPSGYLPVAERIVELEEGREVELVVELVRKP